MKEPLDGSYLARFEIGIDMDADCGIDIVEQPVLYDPSPAQGFGLLGRLEDHPDRSAELMRATGARSAAVASPIAVWASWPQACITPGPVDANARPVSSVIGSASISARMASFRLELPAVPTMSTTCTGTGCDCAYADALFLQPAQDEGLRLVLFIREFGLACRWRRDRDHLIVQGLIKTT